MAVSTTSSVPKRSAASPTLSPLLRYGIALCFAGIAATLRPVVGEHFSQTYPFFFFVIAVLLSALYAGRGPAFFATGFAIAFVEIRVGVETAGAFGDATQLVRALVFGIIGTVITLAVDKLQRSNERLRATGLALVETNALLKKSEDQLIAANHRLRRSEADLIQANSRFKQSNDELETFAYAVAHDLRTPLRTIGAFCQILEERRQETADAESKELLGHIDASVRRMSRLITDLLEYSTATQLEPALVGETDCDAVLQSVLTDYESAISESQANVTSGPLPTMLINPRQLGQILGNLVGNALKYRSTDPPEIHITANAVDGNWVFSVKDNGIGFDPQFADRIFRPFERLHTSAGFEGCGLGLAIVKRVVDHARGSVWAESIPGEGSIFHVSLPKVEPGPQAIEPVALEQSAR